MNGSDWKRDAKLNYKNKSGKNKKTGPKWAR